MAQLAISPLVSTRKSSADAWATAQIGANEPPPPPYLSAAATASSYDTPPPLRAAPPMLRRQNASRFSWPPDEHQEWTYIMLSPEEIVEQAARLLGATVTVEEVCQLFLRRASVSRAYGAYAHRWRSQLEEVLR
eukprot:469847-Prymnesium_polylepis.2